MRWANGQAYEGEFRDGMMDGRGRMTTSDGAVYQGKFKRSFFNGQGTRTFAKARADGTMQQSGTWRYGMLEGEQREQRRLAALNVETALYNQRALLAQAIGALAPRNPARISRFLLAIGGDGSQEVFRREVELRARPVR